MSDDAESLQHAHEMIKTLSGHIEKLHKRLNAHERSLAKHSDAHDKHSSIHAEHAGRLDNLERERDGRHGVAPIYEHSPASQREMQKGFRHNISRGRL